MTGIALGAEYGAGIVISLHRNPIFLRMEVDFVGQLATNGGDLSKVDFADVAISGLPSSLSDLKDLAKSTLGASFDKGLLANMEEKEVKELLVRYTLSKTFEGTSTHTFWKDLHTDLVKKTGKKYLEEVIEQAP